VKLASARPALLAEVEIPALLDLLPSGVLVVDSHARPVLINEAARRLLGDALDRRHSAVEAALRMGMRAADTNRRVPRDQIPLARALRGERVHEAEYAVDPPSADAPMWLRISAFPLREGGAVSIFSDITSARRAQDQVARLHEAEHRLRLALEASRMSTWSYELDRDWVEVAPEISASPASPLNVLAGPLQVMMDRIHPEDRPRLTEALRGAVERAEDVEVEARVVHADAPPSWLLIKGRVFRGPRGRAQQVMGIAMDISERKEAEAARQMLAHAERLRALGEMASGIAHDLNQSLALISGYSEMARQELQLPEPDLNRTREMCEITARAAIEGGQALKRLLSFARTQEFMGETENVDVEEVVREAARLTAPRWRDAAQAEGRPISLDVETEHACTIEGSASALREALINLIFNAVDALPAGGTIRVRCRRVGERVQVEVQDSGTGIPPQVRARIFDPFFTTKGERGTGLGLAQVLSTVQRFGGTIDLDSEPGRGTTFRLMFPYAARTAAVRQPTPERAQTSANRSITILVVDDEPQLARMAALALAQRGHHVLVARSGEEALAELQQRRADLVVSDLGLGSGINGWDLAEEVRKRWPGTCFVLVTGWGAAITPDEARERGVNQVLAKPYRIAELRQIADRVAAGPETR
jgi:signal transduction histidine kinase/CheY-like chemotaxis protein